MQLAPRLMLFEMITSRPCEQTPLCRRLFVWGKRAWKGKGKWGGGGGDPVDKYLRALFRHLVIVLPIICQQDRSLSINFRAWVTPGKINGKWAVFCSVWKLSEMEREPHCRFCKKWLISGKRINTVPVFGVTRNKTLLVDSGQDSVVLAQAFES